MTGESSPYQRGYQDGLAAAHQAVAAVYGARVASVIGPGADAGWGLSARQLVHAKVRNRDGSTCQRCSGQVHWTDRRSARGGTYALRDSGLGITVENTMVVHRGCKDRT